MKAGVPFIPDPFPFTPDPSEPAGAALAAMVAGLSAGLDRAGLLVLEELDEFGDGLAETLELLLARV
jgi:hypothetical protein